MIFIFYLLNRFVKELYLNWELLQFTIISLRHAKSNQILLTVFRWFEDILLILQSRQERYLLFLLLDGKFIVLFSVNNFPCGNNIKSVSQACSTFRIEFA